MFSQTHFTPYVIPHIVSMNQQPREKTDVKPLPKRRVHFSRSDVLEIEAYLDFKFQHKFSLLVMGPTRCGKTWLAEKLLTTDRMQYPSKKPRRIWWYYNQCQDRYQAMQSTLGRGIHDLPEFFRRERSDDRKCVCCLKTGV